MYRFIAAATFVALAALSVARGQPLLLDDCSAPARWQVLASDGVEARIRAADGALRLDYDFRRGAGFCIARKPLELDLPANYRFQIRLRSDGPPNDLEFKLLDSSLESVWWVKERAYEFPREWTTRTFRQRHFKFAWGPSGGAPLTRLGAIEIAIAAASGGRGSVWLDELTFEPLPETAPATQPASIATSSGAIEPSGAWDGQQPLAWRSAADDPRPTLTIDFGAIREIGGVALAWAGDFALDYALETSGDADRWEPIGVLRGAGGGRQFVPTPDAEGRHLRLRVERSSADAGVRLDDLRILPPAFGATPNAPYAMIAAEAPPGRYPRYFLGRQTPWTVVGVPGDDHEALIDVFGAIEPHRGGFRIEPLLIADGRLLTWNDFGAAQSLLDGYLPIPSVTLTAGDVELQITAVAHGLPGSSQLAVRYTLTNRGPAACRLGLLLTIRPFQILPPWHELNLTGGVARVDSVAFANGAVRISDRFEVRLWNKPDASGAFGFARGDVVEAVARGDTGAAAVVDPWRRASGFLRYDVELPAGGQRVFGVSAPLNDPAPPAGASETLADAGPDAAAARFDGLLAQARAEWTGLLNRAAVRLPPAGQKLQDTFRATQAYILINADGPALQPGSRTYERSWIRDGALSSTALLYTGHTDAAARFLDWYAPFQFENGKVPCVVDRRGPDPVPEHDSTGQLIYALHNYYRFTHDPTLLQQHYPRVAAGVGYLADLRAERLTPEYRDGPPEQRVLYGLVTESISHEGYSAKPMHSYWDGFWVVRGLKDAADIAGVLGHIHDARRFAVFRDAYRASLSASIELAMRNRSVDFIPGCAELGDFDATSTATAVFPCGETDHLPRAALLRTFERYLAFFRDRRDGRIAWRDYTPYEIRIASTLIHLGQPAAAHELLDWFFQHQYPPGWNHWAEVVHHDPLAPRFIGDMPHTWVGAEFICAVRSMFVYERERDQAVVLAAGVRPEWLAEPGIRIDALPTEYGLVSYRLSRAGQTVELEYECRPRRPAETASPTPPGGFVLKLPLPEPVAAVKVDGRPVQPDAAGEVALRRPTGRVVITLAGP